jgi:hypothetical protein
MIVILHDDTSDKHASDFSAVALLVRAGTGGRSSVDHPASHEAGYQTAS